MQGEERHLLDGEQGNESPVAGGHRRDDQIARMRRAAQLAHLHVAERALRDAIRNQWILHRERLCRADRIEDRAVGHAAWTGMDARHFELAELPEQLEQVRHARISGRRLLGAREGADAHERRAQGHRSRKLVLLEAVVREHQQVMLARYTFEPLVEIPVG